MKISQMLKREDFYEVNRETLTDYFGSKGDEKPMYVYPQLNAIITKTPSDAVKDYLFCEYKIRGNALKAMLAKAYVWACLISRGKMASKKILMKNTLTDDMLIYPCNKKYRIFNFREGVVDVIAKSGFPTGDLKHEIEFRSSVSADFVPQLVFSNDIGYREKIIDGTPLARITEGFEEYRTKALDMLRDYAAIEGKEHKIPAEQYTEKLAQRIKEISENNSKKFDRKMLAETVLKLTKTANNNEEVLLTMSHGDLQPGNIWIEKGGKIYIIDWESWDERSVWYDEAALYRNLRNANISEYIKNTQNKTELAVVCLEDLIFHLNELYNLPYNYGEIPFADYLAEMSEALKGENEEIK